MRILVAGASGAVGRQLMPLLVSAGHEVIGASRHPERVPGATGVVLDALDPAEVLRVVGAARPDVVLHQLTALAGGRFADNARIRREGTRNLVDAAKATGVSRFITQSICWVYEPGDPPATEDTPLDPTTAQPRADTVAAVRALEEAAAEIERHVILRYGMLYGPGTWYAPGEKVDQQLRAGDLPATDAVTSFLHVTDAALAAVAALDWPTGVFNVVDDEPAAGRDWVPVLANALGAPAPEASPGRAGWERGASNALVRGLGWRPRFPSWRTGFPAIVS